ncbi:DUF6318 family protein [Actinomyces qiguomingii]|uniref:DUF6318 family protein n=1 Tax=Actinomyces qiguomingii TaxID=2057800 RepID=UPI0022B8ACD6|nr:DUF6318 family protein [Actinomyces qiguomingii]
MSTAPTRHHNPRRYRVSAAVARRRLRSDGSTRGVAEAGRALLLVAVAGCLVVLGAGCSRGSGASSFYSPTWTPPATTTASASASATPTLPPEQAAARATALAMEAPQPYTPQFTPEGAAEAATYFLNLFPYVFATGDLEAWKNMSKDDCKFCNNVATDVAARHDAGGWVDPWEQEITALGYLVDENDPNRYVIRTQVVSEAHTDHSEDGTATEYEITDDVQLVQLYWIEDNWKIETVALEREDDSE